MDTENGELAVRKIAKSLLEEVNYRFENKDTKNWSTLSTFGLLEQVKKYLLTVQNIEQKKEKQSLKTVSKTNKEEGLKAEALPEIDSADRDGSFKEIDKFLENGKKIS